MRALTNPESRIVIRLIAVALIVRALSVEGSAAGPRWVCYAVECCYDAGPCNPDSCDTICADAAEGLCEQAVYGQETGWVPSELDCDDIPPLVLTQTNCRCSDNPYRP